MFDHIFGEGDKNNLKMEITSLLGNKLNKEDFNGFTKWQDLSPEEFSNVLFFMIQHWDLFFRDSAKVSQDVLPTAVVEFFEEAYVIHSEKKWISLYEMKLLARAYNASLKHGEKFYAPKDPEPSSAGGVKTP